MIMAFRHISLRVPQPGRVGSTSREVSYVQVSWIVVSPGPDGFHDVRGRNFRMVDRRSAA
jgi:hypothetical protein